MGFSFCVVFCQLEENWNAVEIYTSYVQIGEFSFEWISARSFDVEKLVTIVEIFQSCTEPPSSWCSTNGSFRHSDSSLYPDSLNQETSSVTGTTRVEFIIGSPTRRFRQSSVWPHRYFDSIDSAAMLPESLLTDEFSLRRGEALAECDSLECHPISNESWIADVSFVGQNTRGILMGWLVESSIFIRMILKMKVQMIDLSLWSVLILT